MGSRHCCASLLVALAGCKRPKAPLSGFTENSEGETQRKAQRLGEDEERATVGEE